MVGMGDGRSKERSRERERWIAYTPFVFLACLVCVTMAMIRYCKSTESKCWRAEKERVDCEGDDGPLLPDCLSTSPRRRPWKTLYAYSWSGRARNPRL